jgi:hypothetical protein
MMDWPENIDLEKMVVAAAPFGGPIAVTKDWKQFHRVSGSSSTKPVIHIFTASGNIISTINVRIFI